MASAIQTPGCKRKTILLADHESKARECLQLDLRSRGYAVETVVTAEQALERLQAGEDNISLLLMDFLTPGTDGLEVIRRIHQLYWQLPVIVLSCTSAPATVVEAMKSGATDFLSKPISNEHVGHAVEKALGDAATSTLSLVRSNPGWESQPFIPIKSLEAVLAKIGASSVPVLIQGETGVGKEVVARRLHAQSVRTEKRFLKLNCAALPGELIESELFGYERGAFTGASQRKPGMFELADGGTILLDEIGDMDLKLQAKLLQVLQDQEFQRVGGQQTVRVNVRVIAATHCDLDAAVAANRFRADLYYRLNVVSLWIPPLRERRDEIIPIAECLIRRHADGGTPGPLPTELRRAFREHSWPGNVRELENVVRRWLVFREPEPIIQYLKRQATIMQTDVGSAPNSPSVLMGTPKKPFSGLHDVKNASRHAETETIVAALNSARWSRKKAAAALGVDYKALLYKMKKLGIGTG